MTFRIFLVSLTSAFLIIACGRGPSRLLRQAQAPIFDYPLYISEGAPGRIWKYDRDRNRELLIDGLSDPRGIATDRSNNLFVVEQGADRLRKVNTTNGESQIVRENLNTPSVVAVNSVGEVFVAQDGDQNIIRADDGQEISSYSARPSALAFGVEDILLVGLFDSNQVLWGTGTDASAGVNEPVGISTDANGRVYAAEGSVNNARILRFHQTGPEGLTIVADALSGVAGMVVDPVGNIYAVEQGAARIILITFDGQLFTWVSDVIDPQYIAFTQY